MAEVSTVTVSRTVAHSPEHSGQALLTWTQNIANCNLVIQTRPQINFESLWQEARAQFLNKLPLNRRKDEEAFRDDTTLEDTVKDLSLAKAKAEKAYGSTVKGQQCETKLSRAVNRLDLILRVGDGAVKFVPETASYVWAGFRLVASAISHDFRSCQFLVGAIDQMSDTLFVCEVFAERQLGQMPVSNGKSRLVVDEVLTRIPLLLALVLKFAYEARRLFVNKGRISRTFSMMLGGDQGLRDTVKEAELKKEELIQASTIAFDEAVTQWLRAMEQDHRAILQSLGGLGLESKRLLETVDRIDEHGAQMAGNVHHIMDEQRQEKQFREIQEWDAELRAQMVLLQSEGIANLHEPRKVLQEHIARKHPGTCEWIIANPKFVAWLQHQHSSVADVKALLWLSGETGFGKSILMSHAVDYLERKGSQARPTDKAVILRFLCKLGNDAAQEGARVLAHLLSQLLSLATSVEEKPETKQRCMELGRRLGLDAATVGLKTDSARVELFCDLARAFGRRVHVLIDALDECENRDEGLLASLVQIAETDSDIRVLVSSRPEHNIQRAFAKYGPPRICVAKDTTERDVAAYIAASLKAVTRFDQSQRRKAAAHIAMRAAGMFRCEYCSFQSRGFPLTPALDANLAIESLRSPSALRKPFRQLLSDMPDGLTAIYEQELIVLEPGKRELLMVALRWLVCGEGPISLTLMSSKTNIHATAMVRWMTNQIL